MKTNTDRLQIRQKFIVSKGWCMEILGQKLEVFFWFMGGIECAYHTNSFVRCWIWLACNKGYQYVAPWVNWQIVLMFDKEQFIKLFSSLIFSNALGPISTNVFTFKLNKFVKMNSIPKVYWCGRWIYCEDKQLTFPNWYIIPWWLNIKKGKSAF